MAPAAAADDRGTTINVLMANNEPFLNLQKLTADHFTKDTGIVVNFTVLPENDLRDKGQQEFSSQAGQYNVASLSNFEIPIWGGFGWLAPLNAHVAADPGFAQDDVFPAMSSSLTAKDGKLYGEPFYGESSFTMYRKDIFAKLGLTMPDHPTWDQIANFAAKADGADSGMRGICLRGLPGWGQQGAVLNTIVNTFGGTWFTKDWAAKVNAPEYTAAVQFYVDLLRAHGPADAATLGTSQCLDEFKNGKVAILYNSTALAGLVDAADSPVAGKVGFVQAPVEKTASSGWLYTWAWAIQAASKHKDAAWKFIAWASSKEYEQLAGSTFGWGHIPDGKRTSTYANPNYKRTAGDYANAVLEAIKSANPTNPGLQPRPTVGVQFVAIPEFAELGTRVSQLIANALTGRMTVKDALDQGQTLAEKVAADYK